MVGFSVLSPSNILFLPIGILARKPSWIVVYAIERIFISWVQIFSYSSHEVLILTIKMM